MMKIFYILALSITFFPALAKDNKPSEKELKKNACYKDIQKHCPEFSNGPRQAVLQCLMQNEANLSKGCKKLRNANKPKQDDSPEAQEMREKIHQMVAKSCGEYVNKYCQSPDYDAPGAKLTCLAKQKDLSKECTETLASEKKMGKEARKAKK